ncbi:hypothetical protein WM15_27095 [Burkholderia ubonensis]|nr:hypothetical protein WM15_27095 [Burkholderia ubonensis]
MAIDEFRRQFTIERRESLDDNRLRLLQRNSILVNRRPHLQGMVGTPLNDIVELGVMQQKFIDLLRYTVVSSPGRKFHRPRYGVFRHIRIRRVDIHVAIQLPGWDVAVDLRYSGRQIDHPILLARRLLQRDGQ